MTVEARPQQPGLDVAPTLPKALGRTVERYGDRAFLLGGPRPITYGEADAESGLRARGLLALGLGKGARIGLMMPNGDDWVLNWLAVGRMGGIAVCLSTFFQVREIDWALKHNDIDTLLISARHLGHDYVARLEAALPGLADQAGPTLHLKSHPFLRRIIVWGECDRPWAMRGPDALRDAARANPQLDNDFLAAVEAQIVPADDLMIICTSGTTADPKAVLHTHANCVRNSWDYLPYGTPDLNEDDRLYAAMPLFWVGGPLCALMPVLFVGAAIIFSETTHPADVVDVVLRERATYLILGWSVPGFYDEAARRGADLPLVRFPQHPSPIPPDRRAAGSLGMTETFGTHSAALVHIPTAPGKGGNWGRPLGAIERRIVDPESGATLAAGVEGELQLRGPNLMRGYYKRERAEAFTPDGFFATGDRCLVDEDGDLYFHGRLTEMIKTSGANVAPREVEAVLVQLPEVREAIVFGVLDERRGEAVAAVVVPEGEAAIDPDALRAYVRSLISSYKAPTLIISLGDADIPRTSTGKVKKGELRERLLSREAGS